MRGSLRKRSKNSWTIIVDLEKDATGKRRQKWITCHGNKRNAERRLAEIITEINAQLYITHLARYAPSDSWQDGLMIIVPCG